MSFSEATVLSFESRRAKEIAELIRNNGGTPLVAPALKEVPLEENSTAFQFAGELYRGAYDMVIFLTGVGTRLLGRILATRDDESRFIDALRRITVVARGPKPTAVLREWKVPIAVTVPEPNTWRELLAAVAPRPERSVALQEYGRPNSELIDGLTAQNRRVHTVPVYQWAMPDDTGPLAHALEELLSGHIGVSMFTTSIQLEHFLEFAARHGRREAAVEALRNTFIASIGPDCSETLRQHGLTPTLEPTHPKMGILVHEAAAQYALSR